MWYSSSWWSPAPLYREAGSSRGRHKTCGRSPFSLSNRRYTARAIGPYLRGLVLPNCQLQLCKRGLRGLEGEDPSGLAHYVGEHCCHESQVRAHIDCPVARAPVSPVRRYVLRVPWKCPWTPYPRSWRTVFSSCRSIRRGTNPSPERSQRADQGTPRSSTRN